MAVNVWFRDDLKHILLAAERASLLSATQAEALTADPEQLRAYRRGFQAALAVVAVACGVGPLGARSTELETAQPAGATFTGWAQPRRLP
jgi:hypothetical protein